MTKKRAVFGGTARDCAWYLPSVFQNVEALAESFSEIAVVVVENDSTDATKSLLASWLAKAPNGTLINLDGLAAAEGARTQRIATARNAALSFIRSSLYNDWEYLVLLDFDEVNSHPISRSNFDKAITFLESNRSAAAVFANPAPNYYDIWALRKRGWCTEDCWNQVTQRPNSLSESLAKIFYVFARQVEIPERVPPIQVVSAFAGLGIYKMAYTKGCNYNGLDGNHAEICEHIGFHADISKQGGQLFIFPKLINQAPQAHLFNPNDFGRRDRLILGLLRLWAILFPPWRQQKP